MQVFFVSGVDTNVGKTFVTHRLVQALQAKGVRSIALKPIETGVEENGGADSRIHLEDARNLFADFDLSCVNFFSFAPPCAPYVADCKNQIDIDLIIRKIADLRGMVDVLFVEGAGGLFVPIKKDFFMYSFASKLQEYFDARTLLVCDDHLGMINRFLSAKFILDSLKLHSIFFVNVRQDDIFRKISLPFMQDYDFEMQIEALIKNHIL
ncbi:dethiobiotin synthase [Helicobacter pametensis]|uniref:dethiobiotin synthase n=1 Tax=Helicobacter pametensis TaxID=95149 RepID=UPI0004895226|nr:dethiobiotin synthase [Helicobacter pametensis]